MKLSDIDQNLNEAPVNFLKRGLTKLKKHTPFSKGARRKAEVQDAIEDAANNLAVEWQGFLGTGDVDKNAVTPEQIHQFLKITGFLKTGQTILANAVKKKELELKQKAWKKTYDPRNPTPSPMDLARQNESYEARLAVMLIEADDEDFTATFNTKEVETMLHDIIKTVAKDNPDGLINKYGGDQPETVSVSDDGGGEAEGEPLSREQLEAAWDQIADNLPMSDEHKEVFKVAFDNAAKAVASGKVSAK